MFSVHGHGAWSLAGRKGYKAIFNEESQIQEEQKITTAKLQVTRALLSETVAKRNEKQLPDGWGRC